MPTDDQDVASGIAASWQEDAASGPFADLFAEAKRELTICNSCRYCEGYCAVFPAMERRRTLTDSSITHLANLCHDCRACLYACMYAPPHDFGVDLPAMLSEVRARSWDQGLRPRKLLIRKKETPVLVRTTVLSASVLIGGLILLLAVLTEGLGQLWQNPRGSASPYDVISYPALLIVMGIPFILAAVSIGYAGISYWRGARGSLRGLFDMRAWLSALYEAARLRYLRGGGEECFYPVGQPSPTRRRLHAIVAYGFLLCAVSTISASVLQDILGSDPPYPPISVPVVTGTLGGLGMVIGCIGLIALKRRTDPAASFEEMIQRDYNLLVALTALGVTGLLVLIVRTTPAYGLLLVIHLATVAVCFSVAPYTKFNHVVYRLLALVIDNLEREEEAAARTAESGG